MTHLEALQSFQSDVVETHAKCLREAPLEQRYEVRELFARITAATCEIRHELEKPNADAFWAIRTAIVWTDSAVTSARREGVDARFLGAATLCAKGFVLDMVRVGLPD